MQLQVVHDDHGDVVSVYLHQSKALDDQRFRVQEADGWEQRF